MDREDAKKYRGIAARLNYLSPDQMDIGFAVKEAARNMSKPLIGNGVKLNRIGQYLMGRPRLVSLFAWQAPTLTVTAYTDSDWPAANSGEGVRRYLSIDGADFANVQICFGLL